MEGAVQQTSRLGTLVRTQFTPTIVLCASSFVGMFLESIPARAQQRGTAWDAQPGLSRVALAEAAEPTLAATVGYGVTEPLTSEDGAHHRFSSRFAGAFSPLTWLNVGATLDGRYDAHRHDEGEVIDAALAARAFTAISGARLGVELRPWLPGAEQLSTAVDGLSLDARSLFGFDWGKTRFATMAGYRFDRSQAVGENAARLSFADRVALGASDFDAVLLGAGVGTMLGHTEALAEASGDILVGADAPALTKSPLRMSAGVRQHVSTRVTADLVLCTSLGARPEITPTSPLVPIEPRFSVFAGIRYQFTSREPPRAPVPALAPGPAVVPPPKVESPPPARPSDTSVEFVVLDDQGQPLPGAKVSLTLAGKTQQFVSDAEGRHQDPHAPLGAGEVSVTSEGFEPMRREFVLEAGVPLKVELKLTALPPPSQLRGVVRSFGGQGLPARVRIAPLDIEVTTDQAGAFEVDVPPGEYEITIQADGYETQKRRARVEPQGVVILNADLARRGAKR
jgi:hypothetical protein